ncbi:MAG: aminopeptidase P family protein [Salinarimonas sp.]|nr:aminopeptidase P family protein [Salinarimonas sp.]
MSAPFQTFDDPVAAGRDPARLKRLRTALATRGVAAFLVPRADEHQSEYTPPHAERLAWLTGFTGSAGLAVVMADEAALFTDGRYTLQAPQQIDTTQWSVIDSTRTRPFAWLAERVTEGDVVGFDPWLMTARDIARLRKQIEAAGARLQALDDNPLDSLWDDRPPPPAAPLWAHPAELAGEEIPAKLERIRRALTEARFDALVVSDPHNLCWAFNLRGADIQHTPIVLGYALIPAEGRPTLFLAGEKYDSSMRAVIAQHADLAEPDALSGALTALAERGARLRIDEATGAEKLRETISASGGDPDLGADPITLMKARKNTVEIAGSREAHLRDGVAVARFLAWFADTAPRGGLTEIDAVRRLEELRGETNALVDISFPTIAGSGPNGAIVHYRVTHDSNRKIAAGELFLIDSGAQYRDGTTDITRTLVVGEPTPDMRAHYTRVLKGHIAIARAVFPEGTTGAQLDALARLPLWEAGLDFDHGTGHGVGSFLSVHEGPQRISKAGSVALEAGMILSNEPGYYKAGGYGIRIENLILVEPRAIAGGERAMLGFETLTLAPFERRLIEPALLGRTERAWIDAYHARVFEKLALSVDDATRAWLEGATRPLAV